MTFDCCSGFYSGRIHFIGENINKEEVTEYNKMLFFRCKNTCFRSVNARNISDRFDADTAKKQFCETNMINTVSQGYKLCKKINMDNIHVLADLYHVGLESDIPIALNS